MIAPAGIVATLIVLLAPSGTLSGIANDFIEHGKNALVVEYNNSESIYEALKKLFQDEILRNTIIENGRESVKEFTFETKYKKLYLT